MKRKSKRIIIFTALVALGGVWVVGSCGTEQPGTNGPSEDYFPTAVGDRWVYDTFNLTRDPNRQDPLYTHVSVEYVVAAPGAEATPIFVTKYAKGDNDQALRLNQAGYWVNKDIFFKYDYFSSQVNDYFMLHGYNYLNEYRDAVIGTYFYNGAGQRAPMSLFKVPIQDGVTWDVLDRTNPDPLNNPTVYQNIDQKDYFGLLRDLDNDNAVDTMDISIVGTVSGREIIETDLGSLNCFKIVHTQNLLFHLSSQGDTPDVSTTTYWIAPSYGVVKVEWYKGSAYLDNLEMQLRTWWFVK